MKAGQCEQMQRSAFSEIFVDLFIYQILVSAGQCHGQRYCPVAAFSVQSILDIIYLENLKPCGHVFYTR